MKYLCMNAMCKFHVILSDHLDDATAVDWTTEQRKNLTPPDYKTKPVTQVSISRRTIQRHPVYSGFVHVGYVCDDCAPNYRTKP